MKPDSAGDNDKVAYYSIVLFKCHFPASQKKHFSLAFVFLKIAAADCRVSATL